MIRRALASSGISASQVIDGPGTGRLWANLLAKAEADAVLVACLDLSGALRFAETELPLVDAADCLARGIVKRWMSVQSPQQT